ncbi:hypothetical protein PVNG_02488 [Plasmodium vivax North Korean]|uniref:Uncharacterized protein n=1 Tax=Plasmodium vivax North Korean TaxID=1035514 RepID=A0A0J9TM06_PLAVI|nr:hypothetical protein PVNG_02488 [Plasmodium vivax North Korean]
MIDPRFVYIGANEWKLREYMDYGEYIKVIGKRVQDISFREVEEEKGETSEVSSVAKTKGRKKREIPEEVEELEEEGEDEGGQDSEINFVEEEE